MIKSNRRHTLFAHNKHRKKDNNNKIDFDDFFKNATILPNKQKPKQLEQDEEEEAEEEKEEEKKEVAQTEEDNTFVESRKNEKSNNNANDNNITESSRSIATTIEAPTPSAVDTSEILKGVIACIDVRTEDGDDVSQKFELAIQSMGGETRKMFSDTVTHLVFKNGSKATLKKAMNKKIFIINLLWISRCQSEGRRLDEKEFLIEIPLALVLTAKRRPKSMKPGKVKGLAGNNNDQDEEDEEIEESMLYPALSTPKPGRRYTFDLSEFKSRFDQENRASKKQRTDDELYSLEQEEEKEAEKEKEKEEAENEMIPKKPVLSAENIADRHNMNDISRKKEEDVVMDSVQLMALNDESVKEHIKASFSIGQSTITNSARTSTIDLRNSLYSLPTNAPLKRKRKLVSSHSSSSTSSNIPPKSEKIIEITETMKAKETKKAEKAEKIEKVKKAEKVEKVERIKEAEKVEMVEKMDIDEERVTTKTTTITRLPSLSPIMSSPSTPPPPPSPPLTSLPLPATPNKIYVELKQTIVFTSLTKKQRVRCENIVNRLGRFEVVSEVDKRTTHVIVGKQRRTKTVVLGLLRGAWLLKPEWLFDVEDEENYTPEKYYEQVNWYPPSTERKSTRLLSASKCIFIKSTLSGIDLIREFIELAGGTVVNSQDKADIIISEEPIKNSKKAVVSDLWIYESIDVWKDLPVDKYLVK